MNRSLYELGRLTSLLIGLTITGHATAAAAVVGRHARGRAAIAVAALSADRMARTVPALGVVLDPAPLIRVSGEIATDQTKVAGAKAKVVLERQQMAQASALRRHQTISLANYQKAREDLAANQAVLAAARTTRATRLAQTDATWGPAMAAVLRKDSDPLPQLATGKAMLVGLSLPPGITLAAPPHKAEGKAAGARFALRLISPVPGMLGRYPGQSFLYEAAAQPGVPAGTTVSASLRAGPERSGVLVPRSAIVWRGGRAFVFQTGSGHHFRPVPIVTDTPTAGGYFVSAVLSPGDRIVVHGADLLLGPATNAAGADRKK